MSEQPVNAPRSSSGGNVWTKKYGVLPLWAWMAILMVLVLMYSLYKKSKSGSNTTTGTGTQSSTSINQPGGVDASLVPQFINQTYDNDTPPTAPNITVNNQVPPPPTVVPQPMAQKSPSPSTVSGAPGSYTTGLAGGLNEWTSNGKYSLNTIAKSHGMTAQQLIASSEGAQNNPALKTYVSKGNLNAPLPSGVQVFIPNTNWNKGLQKT